MKLESQALILDFDPKKTRTEAEATHNLGEKVAVADGRVFRFAKAGGSNISLGKLQLAPAPKTNHHNVAVASAAALGATQVTVTLGATAATANEYAEGYLFITDAAGEGGSYKISGHPAAESAASLTVTLFDPIVATALTTSSEATLIHNNYNGVVEGTSSTQLPVGIPLVSISSGDYGWLQTRGHVPALADENLTLGAWLTAGTSTAGAVEELDDVTAPVTDIAIGWATVAGVDTEYRPIFLTLD